MLSWFMPVLAFAFSISAHGSDACVPDVAAAVEALRTTGTPLRIITGDQYPKGAALPPHHLQGVARIPGTRTIVFSGNASDGAFLYAGRMESLPEHGAWPSNFKCGRGSCGTPAGDRLVKIVSLGKDLPHPGGIQAFANVVAAGVDHGPGKGSHVLFLDFSHPDAPLELSHLRIVREKLRAETVGITRLSTGHYLVVVGSRNSSRMTFYVSAGTDLADPANFFIESGSWAEGTNDVRIPDYQALQLVTQCDGQVYLLGTTGFLLGGWFDFIDVHQIDPLSGTVALKPVAKKHLECKTCLFRAGAGAMIDPDSGELRYYGTAYWPSTPGGEGSKVLGFEEFAP